MLKQIERYIGNRLGQLLSTCITQMCKLQAESLINNKHRK